MVIYFATLNIIVALNRHVSCWEWNCIIAINICAMIATKGFVMTAPQINDLLIAVDPGLKLTSDNSSNKYLMEYIFGKWCKFTNSMSSLKLYKLH